MKCFLFLTLMCIVSTVFCQPETTSVKDIEFPNSPAFILLDQTPSVIERPASAQALAFNILNSFQSGFSFPQNYAVEFTPFWFFKNSEMTAMKYAGYNETTGKQTYFSNIKKASVSMAYLNTKDTSRPKSINNLSVGIRLNLISIKREKDIADLKNAHDNLFKSLRDQDEELRKFVHDSVKRVNQTLYELKVKEFYETFEQEREGQKDNFADILARKPIFALDLAGGYSHFFLDNHFSDNHAGKLGVWLTGVLSFPLSQKKENNYFNCYFIARYLSDGTIFIENRYKRENFMDFGGKTELEFSKLSFAVEYLYRINNYSNTFRASGVISYKLSNQLVLTTAFGKNFGNENNLIFSLGLNVGFTQLIKQLTLADLLNEENYSIQSQLNRGFAIVSKDATLLEAKNEIDNIPECFDVFVTKSGKKDEPVCGFITGSMILREASI